MHSLTNDQHDRLVTTLLPWVCLVAILVGYLTGFMWEGQDSWKQESFLDDDSSKVSLR